MNTHDINNKFIDIKIIEHKSIFIISIKNPTNQSFQYNNDMKTTKKDKINHGYGLSIIKNVVNKYDGNIDFESENNIFHVNILLKGGKYIW